MTDSILPFLIFFTFFTFFTFLNFLNFVNFLNFFCFFDFFDFFDFFWFFWLFLLFFLLFFAFFFWLFDFFFEFSRWCTWFFSVNYPSFQACPYFSRYFGQWMQFTCCFFNLDGLGFLVLVSAVSYKNEWCPKSEWPHVAHFRIFVSVFSWSEVVWRLSFSWVYS